MKTANMAHTQVLRDFFRSRHGELVAASLRSAATKMMKGVTLAGTVRVVNRQLSHRSNAMEGFIQRHKEDVIGVLSGFDRVLFRGTLRSISYADGLDRFLGAVGVKYKDFGTFAEGLSERLKSHAQAMALQVLRAWVVNNPGQQQTSGGGLPIANSMPAGRSRQAQAGSAQTRKGLGMIIPALARPIPASDHRGSRCQ